MVRLPLNPNQCMSLRHQSFRWLKILHRRLSQRPPLCWPVDGQNQLSQGHPFLSLWNQGLRSCQMDSRSANLQELEQKHVVGTRPISLQHPHKIPTTGLLPCYHSPSSRTCAPCQHQTCRPQAEYLQAIRSFMYTMVGTRPNLCYAVSYLARFSSNPLPEHWTAIHHLLCYIEATLNLSLLYTNSKSPL